MGFISIPIYRNRIISVYTGGKINDSIILQLLENANWAPTHKLTEPWRFKVFTDKGLKQFAEYQANEYYKTFESAKCLVCCTHWSARPSFRGSSPKFPAKPQESRDNLPIEQEMRKGGLSKDKRNSCAGLPKNQGIHSSAPCHKRKENSPGYK